MNGARLRAAEQLRSESATLVFTPDRLAIVKAGPAARRAYFDRTLGRLFPSRVQIPPDYAAALAQRNAALKRGNRTSIAPWTEQIAGLGTSLVEARRETLALLNPLFATRAAELGLEDARLSFEGEPPSVELRTWTTSRSWPAHATCVRSARRGSSARLCLRCCSRRRR